ncbi:hypothetical protein ACFC34_35990 [Streptomyces sp. NPDC056053]|uniref:hypothetical protein n=1 Tax=Streptomyces sp. NPDC056053 TaxID=3345696 RepID=UPI0035DA5134
MNRSVRSTALAAAEAATESLDVATVVIGGAIGAWAAYTYYPDTWSGDWRLALTGVVAVVAAVAVNSLAGTILAPMRRLLNKARGTQLQITVRTAPAAPATLDEGLAQVAAATEAHAAHRAAAAAWRIDQSENFLRDETRWRGYEDGDASFFLAPGVWLHYSSTENEYSTRNHCFTLLTGDSGNGQPAFITGVEQIRHRLAARAAGLPVAVPATGDRDENTDDLLTEFTDQLKALEA